MKRKELLDTLAKVRPALSTNDSLSPIFTHYCFDGDNLIAYDGARLGVTVPFKSKFKGGVPGRTFDDLLSHVGADEVQLAMVPGAGKDGNLEIKAGKAIMTLASINMDDLSEVFKKEFLDAAGQPVEVDGKALLATIACCLNSLGDNAAQPEQTGLYFRRDRDYLVVYGFNGISLSVSELFLTGGDKNKLALPDDGVLLPGVFCRLMVDYLKDDDETDFEVGERFASMANGKLSAFGHLMVQPTVIDFEKILNENFPKEREKQAVAIPAGLKEALERACVIINTKLDGQLRTEIEVKNGVATILSRSQRGVVDDQVDMPNHPDVTLAIDPRPVLNALPFYGTVENPGKLLFDRKCAVFSRATQTYMVAAFQPKDTPAK